MSQNYQKPKKPSKSTENLPKPLKIVKNTKKKPSNVVMNCQK